MNIKTTVSQVHRNKFMTIFDFFGNMQKGHVLQQFYALFVQNSMDLRIEQLIFREQFEGNFLANFSNKSSNCCQNLRH